MSAKAAKNILTSKGFSESEATIIIEAFQTDGIGKKDLDLVRSEIRNDIYEFKLEIKQDIVDLRQDVTSVRTDLKQEFTSHKSDTDKKLDALIIEMGKSREDMLAAINAQTWKFFTGITLLVILPKLADMFMYWMKWKGV